LISSRFARDQLMSAVSLAGPTNSSFFQPKALISS
jgi:hypothetical protein